MFYQCTLDSETPDALINYRQNTDFYYIEASEVFANILPA